MEHELSTTVFWAPACWGSRWKNDLVSSLAETELGKHRRGRTAGDAHRELQGLNMKRPRWDTWISQDKKGWELVPFSNRCAKYLADVGLDALLEATGGAEECCRAAGRREVRTNTTFIKRKCTAVWTERQVGSSQKVGRAVTVGYRTERVSHGARQRTELQQLYQCQGWWSVRNAMYDDCRRQERTGVTQSNNAWLLEKRTVFFSVEEV